MKKNNMKIKNITLVDQINVIEMIVNSYFTNGRYTPYYAEHSAIFAIVENFIEGVEFEKNEDILECVYSDEDLFNLVNLFFTPNGVAGDVEENEYFNIMDFITKTVIDMVNYKKQEMIHNTENVKNITENFDVMCNVVIDAFSNLAKITTNNLTADQMKDAAIIMKKMAESNMTKEDIVSIMKESVGFDTDKASEEIINSKNEQIIEKDKKINALLNQIAALEKYKRQNEAKNVLADN